MKPIAQTFIATEPDTGVEAVFLTKVDLYFEKKSAVYGVEVQIRETDNGFPTNKVVPYGSKVLSSSQVSVSADASLPTTFEFDTPVMLRTNEQFAIVVVPEAGNDEYSIWVGATATAAGGGGIDIATGAPINLNAQTGSLFEAANEINFTPILNESLKYTTYIAEFTSFTANAVFKNGLTDNLVVTNLIGEYLKQENLVVSNNSISLASLAVGSPTSNVITAGQVVFQPPGSSAANLAQSSANGVVYFANATHVLLNNVRGSFVTGTGIRNANTDTTWPNLSVANQSVITQSACNVIRVPDANTTRVTDFAVGNYIYIGPPTRANLQILQITAADPVANTITVAGNVAFANSTALIGRLKNDANLTGNFASITGGDNKFLTVTSVTSNVSSNFTGSNGALIIGRTSGASAIISDVLDVEYESITTTIPDIEPNLTNINWYFSGTQNNSSRTVDSQNFSISNEIPYDFIDKTRVVMSRSNEFANPPDSGAGTSSLTVTAQLSTANSKITPYIDTIRNSVTTVHNLVYPESTINGFAITYSNTTGNFIAGDTVEQANSTVTSNGTVFFANSSTIYVTNVTSSNSSSIATFNTANSVVYNARLGSVSVSSVAKFNETGSFNSGAARYISKNVVLAEQQDAEDLVCYLTAYRPPETNFKVYGKFLAGADGDTFQSKDWSAMIETTSSALISSAVNTDDLVELVYELPTSVQIIASSATVTNTSPVVNVNSTAAFSAGSFIYVTDNDTGRINVRQVNSVVNATAMIASSNLSITSSNAEVGLIPGLQSQAGAFKYADNSGVVRYITNGDAVFDTFKVFAVKVVLVSNNYHVVPRMADIRCLALQV